jgi:2-oxoglutarate ferredoxin oxidoreductase subunit beta
MTGGQMAPTTLEGMATTTSPLGRDITRAGYPIKMSEMLSTLDGATYISRQSVSSPKYVNAAKKAIVEAFTVQVENKGFSMVEILSTCPTWWGKAPKESMGWLDDKMIEQYPLGQYADRRSIR